ncbi:MAG TPA: heme-binding protein [Acidimicrobiia bacterium]|nr:heme-binding protein [Acidimicrobiia bacterium]
MSTEERKVLSLDLANQIIGAALAEGRRLGLGRLTVAVLDAGGHLIALQREDGSEYLRPNIAIGKAWGALGMGHAGRVLAERAQKNPVFFGALSDMSAGRMVPLAGGVIVRDPAGMILGAVGVSGDTSEQDELAAVSGIAAAGLEPDTGQRPEWRRP